MAETRIVTTTPEETQECGRLLGSKLLALRRGATVCLAGDLGAGKTVFVKGLASAVGIPPRDVGSASFVLVAEYDTTPLFVHIDLYRIERSADLEALGIWDYIGGEAIVVIEWAERLNELPDGALDIRIKQLSEAEREIFIAE
ncbi:MAG TPA: tRNA (adenosine(37)-N6)-threonylcarbamoyltransferase complex ATPase subunit type 1 TsaE [Dissulfurispiraceae bacterium]|nr:tRNA (adenosine(37)-N6)-threonylcarbamoyltransferase complex ATPase subunit type 1 TsaE [Dissulfurispiraceae bacterium]